MIRIVQQNRLGIALMLLVVGLEHCGVIVIAGVLTSCVQSHLDWTSRTILVYG